MTTEAIRRRAELAVVGDRNGHLCPVRCDMAVITRRGRRHVIVIFACSDNTIMTVCANRFGNLIVVDGTGRYGCPSAVWRLSVTGLTGSGCTNMPRTSAASYAAIVATETAGADSRMIDRCT